MTKNIEWFNIYVVVLFSDLIVYIPSAIFYSSQYPSNVSIIFIVYGADVDTFLVANLIEVNSIVFNNNVYPSFYHISLLHFWKREIWQGNINDQEISISFLPIYLLLLVTHALWFSQFMYFLDFFHLVCLFTGELESLDLTADILRPDSYWLRPLSVSFPAVMTDLYDSNFTFSLLKAHRCSKNYCKDFSLLNLNRRILRQLALF